MLSEGENPCDAVGGAPVFAPAVNQQGTLRQHPEAPFPPMHTGKVDTSVPRWEETKAERPACDEGPGETIKEMSSPGSLLRSLTQR